MKTLLGKLEFALERELVIRAPRATVFRYFTDSKRWAKWWGEGSTIDGRVGGAVRIVYPGGTIASGTVLELREPERIVFSYGYEGAEKPIAPGASRVTIRLDDDPAGTRLAFLHEVADAPTRDLHVQGWRYQLAVFATVVASEAHSGFAALADRWFAAWSENDAGARAKAFEGLVMEDVSFRDAYSCTRGRAELLAHVAGAKVHMAGITLARSGEPRQCQGTALVDWVARKADGSALGKGTSVFELTAEGRVAGVVGFWG